jgi:hypothetical protein
MKPPDSHLAKSDEYEPDHQSTPRAQGKKRMKNRKQASENAVKFGQSKAEKLLAATREARLREVLDQHKLTPDSEYDAE